MEEKASERVGDYTGIFLAYFAAEYGSSLGIFLVQEGRITGGDVGGGTYDGEFEVKDNRAIGEVRFSMKQGGQTITGASSDLPTSYAVPISFSLPLEDESFHLIETLTGPVNIRFDRIGEL